MPSSIAIRTPDDLQLLATLMGVVALLLVAATIMTSSGAAAPYTTRLEQQRAQWLAEQSAEEAEQPATESVVARSVASR